MSAPPLRTVLIVEDSVDDRLMLRRLLAEYRETHRILEAATGGEGLALCEVEQPDCVLLDYYLPDMSGSRFLERLGGGAEGGLRVPIALLTGQEDARVASEVLARGAQDYLVKGTLTAQGLVRAIENAIDRFLLQRELEEKRAALELRNFELESLRDQLQEKRAALELRNFELESLRDQLQEKLLELADATQAKDQFLAVMSHEMRTPLNAILGYVDLMAMGIGGELGGAHRAQLERIRVGVATSWTSSTTCWTWRAPTPASWRSTSGRWT